MRRVIAISGKMGSGKDTLANLILERMPSYSKAPLAQKLKEEYAEAHGYASTEALEHAKNVDEVVRQGLIEYGALMRQQDTSHWVRQALSHSGDLIITDMRFPDEKRYILDNEPEVVMVRLEASRGVRAMRRNLSHETDPSETALDYEQDWDFVLFNEASYEDLVWFAEMIVDYIKEQDRRLCQTK